MTEPAGQQLDSGLLELTPASVDELPETPAWYRLLSSGQRIMYVGAAGAEGLREAVKALTSGVPVAGFALIQYRTFEDPAAAEAAAEADVRAVKPLYNEGFERYRNDPLSLPSKGRRVRPAMQNP